MRNLLFIPGLLCDKTLWQPVLQEFKNNYNSQIIDVTFCDIIDELSQVICQNINKETILIGFSLGAWIALSVYAKVSNYCKALILISSAPGSLTTATRQHFLNYIQQISSGHFDEFIEADFEQDVSAANKSNSIFKKTFINMMKDQGPEVAIRQLNAMLNFKGDFSNLSHIHCPTLLIRGIDDKSVNINRQEQMLQEIHRAELVIVPDSAHYVPLENPKITALTIENWLNAQKL